MDRASGLLITADCTGALSLTSCSQQATLAHHGNPQDADFRPVAGWSARHSCKSTHSSQNRAAGYGERRGVKPVGEGVSELRIDYGPGYRVYFKKHRRELIVLLAGGDESTPASDIKTALRPARNL